MSLLSEVDDETPEPWADPQVARALQAASPWWMPPESLALYARWWQLETWLRELIYVELRALHGSEWIEVVKRARVRQEQDAAFTHMAGADSENPLAYLDYSQLVEIVAERWEQFGYALLEEETWRGRQSELKRIRHRIGHLRKPHPDDLVRLEQTLRDLERGTYIALASYNDRRRIDADDHRGAVVDGWIHGQHETARRLLKHAAWQYDTHLQVRTSRRPWARWASNIDNAPGILVHAEFSMRDRTIDARALWHDNAVRAQRELLVHMLAENPWRVEFTFSAVDDGSAISDAIGDLFDAVLLVSRPRQQEDGQLQQVQRRARNLDYRVLAASGWNVVDDQTLPVSSFGAGGSVHENPGW